jgi:hypothetical protein
LAVSLFRKTEGDHDMEGPQHPSTQNTSTGSLVEAKDDPAKQQIRRWLGDIDDARLLGFGLTPEDIALLRGSRSSANFVYLSLKCALSVPSPPGSSF